MAIGESTLGPTVTGVLSLDDVSLEGKTVLLRVDVNSPINPENMEFMDDRRFTEFLPTLDDLSSSKVVIISHQSRPGKLDLHPQSTFKVTIKADWKKSRFRARCLWRISNRSNQVDEDGDILSKQCQNNGRREHDEKSSQEVLATSQIVRNLSGIADAYVTDAFATSHRSSFPCWIHR